MRSAFAAAARAAASGSFGTIVAVMTDSMCSSPFSAAMGAISNSCRAGPFHHSGNSCRLKMKSLPLPGEEANSANGAPSAVTLNLRPFSSPSPKHAKKLQSAETRIGSASPFAEATSPIQRDESPSNHIDVR